MHSSFRHRIRTIGVSTSLEGEVIVMQPLNASNGLSLRPDGFQIEDFRFQIPRFRALLSNPDDSLGNNEMEIGTTNLKSKI